MSKTSQLSRAVGKPARTNIAVFKIVETHVQKNYCKFVKACKCLWQHKVDLRRLFKATRGPQRVFE